MALSRATLSYDQLVARLNFDTDKIDREIGQQADLYQMICEQTAIVGKDLNLLKVQRDTTESRTKLEIRNTLKAAGEKVTENTVDEKVGVDEFLSTIKIQVCETEELYNKWYGLKRAWEMRHESMESVRAMIISGYVGYKKAQPVI